MDSVIKLIDEIREQDATGVFKKEVSKRQVFCKVQSVGAKEFFNGGRNGLNPEYKITMFAADYRGERMVEYEGNTYAIYRTYKAGGDYVELYVERKGGTNVIYED